MPPHSFPEIDSRRWRAILLLTLVGLTAFLVGGCRRRRRPVTVPPRPPVPIVQGEEGLASWYGHPYHGRRTASGETYNMHHMTAAHRTLPFGTMVKVHNLENSRNATVRINDRGPFVKGRIIDLSHAAAQAIRMSGLAPVRLEILNLGSGVLPAAARVGLFAVQVGAFTERRNAKALRDAIAPHFAPVTIQLFDRGDQVFYRVRVGSEKTEEAALVLAEQLHRAGFADATFVVRLD